jgi:hypothetical protein
MIQVFLQEVVSIKTTLAELKQSAVGLKAANATTIDLCLKCLTKILERLNKIAKLLQLTATTGRCELFQDKIKQHFGFQDFPPSVAPSDALELRASVGIVYLGADEIFAEIEGLERMFAKELALCNFAFIPNSGADYFEQDDLFGKPFHNSAPPEINAEIKAAGNCLAADLHTAAAFHSLRAAELGMRRLATHLGVTCFLRDKGKTQVGVDDAVWEELIKGVTKKVESEKLLPPPKRQIKRHFKEYVRLVQQFDHMKKDRNDIMHTHDGYTAEEAFRVYGRVRDFMQRLAKIISLK